MAAEASVPIRMVRCPQNGVSKERRKLKEIERDSGCELGRMF